MNLNRRNFLALGAGAFAAEAFGGLADIGSGAADAHVLKVEPLEIDLGLGKAFKALHLSDTHLNFFDAVDLAAAEPPVKERLRARWAALPQAAQSFLASLDYAKSRGLPLLHTGDLIDCVTEGNERVLAHTLDGLDLQFAFGNHEYLARGPKGPGQDAASLRRRLQRFFRNDLAVSSRILGGANFVSFDNARVKLDAGTIARVRAEFEKPHPIVLLCHIPPFYTAKFLEKASPNTKNVWNSYDQATKDFYTWIQARPQLKAILCGHLHRAESDGFSETAQMYVAGANYAGYAYEITFK